MHELLCYAREDPADQIIALLALHVNNGADPTVLSRQGASAFSECIVNTLGATVFANSPPPDDFNHLLKFVREFEEIDEFDPVPLTISLCAVHSGARDVAARVEPAVKKWLKSHHKQGIINVEDADSLRVLALQALEHRAPELTTDQAEIVLQYAFFIRCSVDVFRILVRPGTVNGGAILGDSVCTPLLNWAAERGDLELVDILLDAGADDQADEFSAFHEAFVAKKHHVIERFLGRFLTREKFPIGALDVVIEFGTLDLAKYLTERVPDVNARLYHGGTLLFTAAMKGDIEKVKFLIERGVDVLARNIQGLTASAHCRKKFKDVSEYLEHEEDKARLKNELKGVHSQVLPSLVYKLTVLPRYLK